VSLWIRLAVLLAVLAAGSAAGWKTRAWKADADDRERIERQAKTEHVQREKVDAASSAFETSRAAEDVRERTVIKEVQRVVEKPVYRERCLDDDGLRILAADVDAANARRQPAPTVPAASDPR
jgi:hypothetical protein